MLRPGQPGRSPGSRWVVGALVLILPREVPRPLGPWGAMQLWGFQKVHRLFPTLSGRTVLSLKLTRKGRGRLKRPFIYIIIFFFQFLKSCPLRAHCLWTQAQNLKNLQLKKSEQPFQGLDCAELPRRPVRPYGNQPQGLPGCAGTTWRMHGRPGGQSSRAQPGEAAALGWR